MHFLSAKLVFSTILALVIHISPAAAFPVNNPIPGGVVVIDVSRVTEPRPNVRFGDKSVFIAQGQTHWVAIVGLPQEALPGKYMLLVESEGGKYHRRSFRINPLPTGQRQRTIEIPEKLEELLTSSNESDESGRMERAAKTIDLPGSEDYEFRQIVSTGSYVPYGWLINNKNPSSLVKHPWVTYITDPDTIVRSPSTALVEQIYLSENTTTTVILNHNNGFVSKISNLKDTILKLGETVQMGEIIGSTMSLKDPSFGRVDWHMVANGFAVDPLLLVSPH